jgi:phosphoribosylamine--glycine ligase
MGAYSPAPVITDELFADIMKRVIRPMIMGLAGEDTPYKGVLYAGIMVTDKGPFVLEFNARFGDPETQAIMPRIKSDLVDILEKAVDGRLENYHIELDMKSCVCVVASSGGYPGPYEVGIEISGLEEASEIPDAVVFHSGTKLGRRASDDGGLLLTSGGRVLSVAALGHDVKEAASNCYDALAKIRFDKMHYRKDIAHKAIAR